MKDGRYFRRVSKMTEEYGHLPDGFFLSQKEIEDLRNAKKELTEYGKKKLQELKEKQKND
jgi:hypothetical protein